MKFRRLTTLTLAYICIALPNLVLAAPEETVVLGTPGQAALAHYDFGSQSALATAPVMHTFALHNGSAVPLVLTRLQASCGCTTAVLTAREGDAALPLVLPPGGNAFVHVSVDPAHLLPGTISKDVWVYAEGQPGPAATLEINGIVVPAAAFTPAALDFSRTPANKAPTLTLTITLDQHIFAAKGKPTHPILISSSPDILLSETAPSQDTPNAAPLTKTYQVRLTPKAQLGVMNERLTLFASAADQTAGRPIPGASVPVLGEVTGEIGASPESIVFGTVSAARGGVQRVTLTAATPEILHALTLFSASPAVTVRLLDPAGLPLTAQSKPTDTASLEVTVTPIGSGHPVISGSLQTQVLVTTADGQQLALPVFVSVVD